MTFDDLLRAAQELRDLGAERVTLASGDLRVEASFAFAPTPQAADRGDREGEPPPERETPEERERRETAEYNRVLLMGTDEGTVNAA